MVHCLSKVEAAPQTINLFLVTKGEQHHYNCVKDLNRLLYDQSAYEGRKHFCERGLHGFIREDLLEDHKPDCRGINQAAVAIEILKPGTEQAKIRFENPHKQLRAPYIIYADYESLIPKIEGRR